MKEYGGLLGYQQHSEMGQSLSESLDAAFNESSNAFLVCGRYTILILKLRENCFAIFDSHPRSENGLPLCNGSAILMFVRNLRDVEKHYRLLTCQKMLFSSLLITLLLTNEMTERYFAITYQHIWKNHKKSPVSSVTSWLSCFPNIPYNPNYSASNSSYNESCIL